jgi:hypothetical protein
MSEADRDRELVEATLKFYVARGEAHHALIAAMRPGRRVSWEANGRTRGGEVSSVRGSVFDAETVKVLTDENTMELVPATAIIGTIAKGLRGSGGG